METEAISDDENMEVDEENIDQSESSENVVKGILDGLIHDILEERLTSEDIARDILDGLMDQICAPKHKSKAARKRDLERSRKHHQKLDERQRRREEREREYREKMEERERKKKAEKVGRWFITWMF